jgi:hypothetical protein
MVELYLHSPIRLHGLALNYFRSGESLLLLLQLDVYTLGTMVFPDWEKVAGA